MSNLPQATLKDVAGEFFETGHYRYTLKTARREYHVSVGSYSGLSNTEKRYVQVTTTDGKSAGSMNYIRKCPKKGGVRCNSLDITGHAWDSELEAIEALARHRAADFEEREMKPKVSLFSKAAPDQAPAKAVQAEEPRQASAQPLIPALIDILHEEGLDVDEYGQLAISMDTPYWLAEAEQVATRVRELGLSSVAEMDVRAHVYRLRLGGAA